MIEERKYTISEMSAVLGTNGKDNIEGKLQRYNIEYTVIVTIIIFVQMSIPILKIRTKIKSNMYKKIKYFVFLLKKCVLCDIIKKGCSYLK